MEPAPPFSEPENRPLQRIKEKTPSRSSRRRSAQQSSEAESVPTSEESGDSDLLIFAAARSAWFTNPELDSDFDWEGSADIGWRAAEQASRPTVGGTTGGGLPRRVPQANLVPGSAASLPVEQSIPARRDPTEIAAYTSGYFRGLQRGRSVEA
jgi:hypothetical protein